MTPRARRLYPLAVFLAGVIAALVIVPLAGQSRRADRAQFDRRVITLAAAAVHARADALARGVRGPAQAFDLGALTLEEVTGLLRLAYAQNDGVAAVTLLDRAGEPVTLRDRAGGRAQLPAVFLPRAGTAGDAHPVESLDDLEQFSTRIPHAQAVARGRALRGPYASVRGNGARVALAEAVPVAEGTETWVLAAEVDAARLLEGLASPQQAGEGELALVTDAVIVGTLARVPDEARAALRAVARRASGLRGPELIAGRNWRAAVARAPDGLDGVVAMAWSGDEDAARRARSGELALGVIVVTIVGALAAALFVAMREAPPPVVAAPASDEGDERAARSVAREGRVLGAVVKELANPIAAASAAARLLGADPAAMAAKSGRVVETLQRSVLRVERAFRRVARLTRAGEERAHASVDLAQVAAREAEAARAEIEQAGLRLETVGLASGAAEGGARAEVRGDEEDLTLLVQVLLDGARSLAPQGSAVRISVKRVEASEGGGVELAVCDAAGATLPARERHAMVELGEGARTETAAPVLAWALAARIAGDHGTELVMRDEGDAAGAGVAAVVTFGVRRRLASTEPG